MMAKTGEIARKIVSKSGSLVNRSKLYVTFKVYAIGHASSLKTIRI